MKKQVLLPATCFALFASMASPPSTDEIRMELSPETQSHYAIMYVYNTAAGENQKFVKKGDGWEESDLAIPHGITGDVRFLLQPETETDYPVMFIYDTETGANEIWMNDYEIGWIKEEHSIEHGITHGVRFLLQPKTKETNAVVYVYSTTDGSNERWVQQDASWEKSDITLQHGINKSVRMLFVPKWRKKKAIMYVYSTRTGENERYVLSNNKWQLQEERSIPHDVIGDVRMVYSPETSSNYPAITVYSAESGDNERWILENSRWEQSEEDIPTRMRGNIRFILQPETSGTFDVMYVYHVESGENEKWVYDYQDDGEWRMDKIQIPVAF